jgi:hypothetical protein
MMAQSHLSVDYKLGQSMMNKSISLNNSGRSRQATGAKNSNAAITKHSQIEETKSEGFVEGEENEDDEELKQMSKSTVWT